MENINSRIPSFGFCYCLLQRVDGSLADFCNTIGHKQTSTGSFLSRGYLGLSIMLTMINPDLEQFMTKRAQSQVIELPGSHAIFLSHAQEAAALRF